MKTSMTICKHTKREFDVMDDWVFELPRIKSFFPNWCYNCPDKQDDKEVDYKRSVFYFELSTYSTKPDLDYDYNTLHLYDLEWQKWNIEDKDSYIDNEKGPMSISVEIEAWCPRFAPGDGVKLTLEYKKCSKKRYEELENVTKEVLSPILRPDQKRLVVRKT